MKLTSKPKAFIMAASDFALLKHQGQKDDSGKDYFDAHLSQVASIMNQVTKDPELLAAAWLHDTIEDTQTTYEELVVCFGSKVADLVMEVTHEGSKDRAGYYFPRLHTKEGIMLKLADRLSNCSRMDAWGKNRQEHYLKKSRFWKKFEGEKR